MDYKYIEQLLERYWDCTATTEEEHILRTFFRQEEVPGHLAKYKSLFEYEDLQAEEGLDEAFDERMLHLVEQTAPATSTTTRRPLYVRMRPLYNAVACIAIALTLGLGVDYFLTDNEKGWDYSVEEYADTYKNPEVAYDEGIEALLMVKEGLETAVADSTRATGSATIENEEEE